MENILKKLWNYFDVSQKLKKELNPTQKNNLQKLNKENLAFLAHFLVEGILRKYSLCMRSYGIGG